MNPLAVLNDLLGGITLAPLTCGVLQETHNDSNCRHHNNIDNDLQQRSDLVRRKRTDWRSS